MKLILYAAMKSCKLLHSLQGPSPYAKPIIDVPFLTHRPIMLNEFLITFPHVTAGEIFPNNLEKRILQEQNLKFKKTADSVFIESVNEN